MQIEKNSIKNEWKDVCRTLSQKQITQENTVQGDIYPLIR